MCAWLHTPPGPDHTDPGRSPTSSEQPLRATETLSPRLQSSVRSGIKLSSRLLRCVFFLFQSTLLKLTSNHTALSVAVAAQTPESHHPAAAPPRTRPASPCSGPCLLPTCVRDNRAPFRTGQRPGPVPATQTGLRSHTARLCSKDPPTLWKVRSS